MLLHCDVFRSHQLPLHLRKELDDCIVFGVHCNSTAKSLSAVVSSKLYRPSPSNCICKKAVACGQLGIQPVSRDGVVNE
ncbi:hypothetical protein TIFTF001_053594, partial [Ficus carica]